MTTVLIFAGGIAIGLVLTVIGAYVIWSRME